MEWMTLSVLADFRQGRDLGWSSLVSRNPQPVGCLDDDVVNFQHDL